MIRKNLRKLTHDSPETTGNAAIDVVQKLLLVTAPLGHGNVREGEDSRGIVRASGCVHLSAASRLDVHITRRQGLKLDFTSAHVN